MRDIIFGEVPVVSQIDVQIEFGEQNDLPAVVIEVLRYVGDYFHDGQRVALWRNGFEEPGGRHSFNDANDFIDACMESGR